MNKIWDTFEQACLRHHDRTAIVCKQERWTYRQLLSKVRQFANSILQSTNNTCDRIGLLLKNSEQYPLAYYSTLLAGRTPFLIDPAFGANELKAIAQSTGVTYYLLDQSDLETFPLPIQSSLCLAESQLALVRLAEDFAAIPLASNAATCRFTSGSTGTPKCLEFSDEAVTQAAIHWAKGTGLTCDDQILCLAALSNGLAFNTSFLPAFYQGATLHLMYGMLIPSFVGKYIQQENISRLVGFPTFYRMLVQSPNIEPTKLAELKIAISAGAQLWPWVRTDFYQRFGLRIADYYGIAETGPVTFELDEDFPNGLGSPLPNATIQIEDAAASSEFQADVGEVLVRTSSMANRYLNVPGLLENKIDAEGFYHTADLGYIAAGRLYIVGRKDSMVIVGGRNVEPSEITEIILSMDNVQDALVFGMEDSSKEMVLHAAVVAPTLKRQDVIAFCQTQLANFKVPAFIHFVPSIPRNGIGKAITSELKSLISAALSAKETSEEV